jgi:hypothetical protein
MFKYPNISYYLIKNHQRTYNSTGLIVGLEKIPFFCGYPFHSELHLVHRYTD